jgi:hypothetical protein
MVSMAVGSRKIATLRLQPHHSPSRTRHSINGEVIDAFVALEICTYGPDEGYYLLHIKSDGRGTDTWHKTLDDTFDQAAFEFGAARDEWQMEVDKSSHIE